MGRPHAPNTPTAEVRHKPDVVHELGNVWEQPVVDALQN